MAKTFQVAMLPCYQGFSLSGWHGGGGGGDSISRKIPTTQIPTSIIQIDKFFLIITATLVTAITTTTIPPSPSIPYHHHNHQDKAFTQI